MKNSICQTMPRLSLIMLIAVSMAALFAIGCQENPSTPNLYDPAQLSTRATPTITNISPATGAEYAAVTTLTVTGTNFSPVIGENLLYFDAVLATISQASTTQLVLTAPNYPKDSIGVSVAVYNAPKLSNIYVFKLLPIFVEYGNLSSKEFPWAITTDAAGDLYVSFQSDSIRQYSPAGIRTGYAASGGATKWSAMKFGPDGTLYLARTQRAIFSVPPGGGTPTVWAQVPGTVFYDLEIDQAVNIWAAGNNTSIYVFKPDKSFKSYTFDANVRSIKLFNNYLYCGGTVNADHSEQVIRFPIINGDSLGAQQTVFNLTTSPLGGAGKSVLAVTGSQGGDLFVGTDCGNPIILVHSSGSAEALYPGLLAPAIHVFAWDKGTKLFGVQGVTSGGSVASSSKILQIQTLQQGLN